MASIIYHHDLSDSQFQELRNLAQVYGIATEVLLKASLEDWLNLQKGDFVDASDILLMHLIMC